VTGEAGVTGGVRVTGEGVGRRRVPLIVGGLLLGTLLGALDQTVVGTALPTVVGDLGGAAHLSWIVTAYLVASTVSTPLWGRLGDRRGHSTCFRAAIVIFLVGSVLSGVSRSMVELVGFRAVQGLGGGGLIVGALAIVGAVAPRERARYQGLFGAVFAVTSLVGPLLGGVVTEHLGWRWIFYLNLPVGALALVITAAVLPRDRPGTPPVDADRPGAGPGALWGNRAFAVTALVSFVTGVVMFGATLYLPLFFQMVRGASPAASGIGLLPLMAGLLATSLGSGVLITRRGRYKMVPVVGSAAMTVGLLLMSRVGAGTSMLGVTVALVVLGAGLGCLMQVLVTAVQGSVHRSEIGAATGGITFARSVGGVLGTAGFGAVFAHLLGPRLFAHPGVPDGLGATVQPARLAGLASAAHDGVVTAYASTLQSVFLVAAGVSALAFALTWLLPEFGPRPDAPRDAL
jgi:MFS family permease